MTKITKEGLIASAVLGGVNGYFGEPIKTAKNAINIIGSNAISGVVVSGADKAGTNNHH